MLENMIRCDAGETTPANAVPSNGDPLHRTDATEDVVSESEVPRCFTATGIHMIQEPPQTL